jgi:hypothetical protein
MESTGTGFVAIGGTARQSSTASNRNRDRGLNSSPSVTSHTSRASTVSRDSHSPRPAIAHMIPRPDSPSLGDQRITSGVSVVSESERGHLRGISETSVSTEGVYATPLGQPLVTPGNLSSRQAESSTSRPGVVSPLTPPTGVEASGDYMSVGSRKGGRRKSNFAEELDK